MRLFTIIVLIGLLVCSGCSVYEHKQGELLMGTDVTITIVDDLENPDEVMEKAFDEIKRIEAKMSVYDQESEISILNLNKQLEDDQELIDLINKALFYSEISEGAFDITIRPILLLWNQVKETGKFPTEQEVQDTLESVGYEKIKIEENRIELDNTEIDLGGIAKGYAIDRAIQTLKRNGVKNAMVNAGGDIRTISDKKKWTIALQNPRDPHEYLTIIQDDNIAITTSGDYERYFITDEKKVTHIADPRTGYSAKGTISVTVIADTATDADALSTAIFVLGKEKGLELANSIKGVECLIIDDNRTIYRSANFP